MGSLCFEGASRSTLLFNPLHPCFGVTHAGLFFTLIKVTLFTCVLGGIFVSKVSLLSYLHHHSSQKQMKFTESLAFNSPVCHLYFFFFFYKAMKEKMSFYNTSLRKAIVPGDFIPVERVLRETFRPQLRDF